MNNPIEHWEAQMPNLIAQKHRGSKHLQVVHIVAAQIVGAKIMQAYLQAKEPPNERQDNYLY